MTWQEAAVLIALIAGSTSIIWIGIIEFSNYQQARLRKDKKD